ncbi:hypothetical protein AN641_02225 [Candidatus Epulonipiscioides gigas]|nr:hypothetical protein AN641_02225 [Epulopiscium sp. SCG-C07WGA-EpuloA2]
MDYLKLVNAQNKILQYERPKNLVLDVSSKIWLEEKTLEMFHQMNRAIQKEGLTALILVEGYRSFAHQKKLVQEAIKTYNTKKIIQAGQSEHQTGLAVDVTTVIMRDNIENNMKFDFTFHKKWLDKNSANFGFILRYPKYKEDITGVEYKPYHYRYIGINHAKQITKLNLCFEEYLEYRKTRRFTNGGYNEILWIK